MTSRATIIHDHHMSELFAKVVFDLEMSILSKERLIKNWDEFTTNVEEAIKNIKGIDYTK